MPVMKDLELRGKGTRFRIFPQPRFLEGFGEAETVWLSPLPGSVGPGPSDDRMYVVDAIGKKAYDDKTWPTYAGPRYPDVEPDPRGHFDHLDVNSREFGAAHMFAVIRRVLDIWEGYFGGRIEWHFRDHQPRLELIPHIDWNNAQSGYGFLEAGYGETKAGERRDYCLNFDVLAHEIGHIIIFSKVGVPDDATFTAEYKGYHESSADLVALISVLHFDSFVDHLLGCCRGNLAAENELNRIAELSRSEQIRLASHNLKMTDVADTRIPWYALDQKALHKLGEPMTGAVFDIFVEVFQEMLVERKLIARDLATAAYAVPDTPEEAENIQARFDAVYAGNEDAFKAALLDARDFLGSRLATTWEEIPADNLHFADVAAKFLTIDRRITGGRYQRIIRDCFLWRCIGYGFVGKSA